MDGAARTNLDHLEGQTIAFLDLAEEIGRPLSSREQKAFRWLLHSFEAAEIQTTVASLPRPRIDYYAGLLANLSAVLAPSGSNC